MTFEVKYRNKEGATDFVYVEAADRAALFAELKKRDISATQVSEATGKKPRKAATGGAPILGKIKGLAALVAVCVIGSVVYLLLPQEAPKVAPTEKPAAKKTIEVVKPEYTPVERPVVAKVEPPKPKKYWQEDVMPPNLSEAQQRKWKHMHRPPPGYTNDTSRTEAPPEYAIFDHPCENTIAGYLTMTPGETLVGSPSFGKKFTEKFLESLKNPIIITQDDTPEQAELKRLMIDTKIDLKARYDEGEDIGKILENTHEEYQRLASLKSDVQQAFSEFKNNPDATIEDVDDFLKAANKLLEEKGVAPLTMSPIAKRMLMRRKGVR